MQGRGKNKMVTLTNPHLRLRLRKPGMSMVIKDHVYCTTGDFLIER